MSRSNLTAHAGCVAWRFGPLFAAIAIWNAVSLAVAENSAAKLTPRPAWNTSRVIGSPEPPPPYTVEPAFTHISWKQPVFAIREPGTEWMLIVEWPQPVEAKADPAKQKSDEKPKSQFTPARVTRVLDKPGETRSEVFFELPERAIYWIEFHPQYQENGQLFVCSREMPLGGKSMNILSRFTVPRNKSSDGSRVDKCDLASEERILEWSSEGHDGNAAVFGHDGMLYVAVGDGSSDSDDRLTAQDPSSLLGKILRIDVDHPAAGRKYSVPQDNPFVHTAGARPEIWSIGHRNPWRMTVDAKTGGIWVGNNGQDLWEFAHLLERGDNCGWSVYEGSHPFYLNRQLGPGRLVPPTIEHDHGVFRSLTGGVVYYGSRHPKLEGAYIYGDYSTGAIWGAYHDGKHVVWNRDLARTTLAIVAIATTHRGELLVVDYASGVYRLIESPPDESHRQFPKKLSETGLFASVADLQPAPGVVPYKVNVPGWTDGATAERLVALPKEDRVKRPSTSQWEFGNGAVLVQILSVPGNTTGDARPRRIETRLLTKQAGVWAGYSYVWNDAQTDAVLAPPAGVEVELPRNLTPASGGSSSANRWKVPGRADCMSCHSRAANFVLGFSELQIDSSQKYGDVELNQLAALEQQHVLEPIAAPASGERPHLVNPYDVSQNLESRARSYLHANCSVCHVAAGGGNSRMVLNAEQKRDEMQLIGAFPQHQSFGLLAAMLVAPGEPDRSVLPYRLSHRGPGQMPPRGTHEVDLVAVQMFRDWIAQMPPLRKFVKSWTFDDLVPALGELASGRSVEKGGQVFRELGCGQCHRIAGSGGGVGPDLSKVVPKRNPRELLESIVEPSKQIAPEFAATVIVTVDGQTHQGRVFEEDDRKVVLSIADGLTEPLVISKSEIEKRSLSATSTMPERLLFTLERSEILDLLAYLIANGEAPAQVPAR